MAYQGVLPEDWVILETAPPPAEPPPEGAEPTKHGKNKHAKGGEHEMIAYGEHNWEDVFAKDGSVPFSGEPTPGTAHEPVESGKAGEHTKGRPVESPASIPPYRTRALPPWGEPFVADEEARSFAMLVGPFADPYSVPVTPEEITQVVREAYEEGGLNLALHTIHSGMTAEEIELVGKGEADLGMGEFGLAFVSKGSPADRKDAAEKAKAEKDKAKADREKAEAEKAAAAKRENEQHRR